MCIDQWDWKTDAPEFVPGSMTSFGVAQVGHVYTGQNAWSASSTSVQSGGRGASSQSAVGSNNNTESAQSAQLRAQYEWQVQSKSEELRKMQNRVQQLEIETAQARASWEMDRRNFLRQIDHYRAVLERYCIPVEDIGSSGYVGHGDSSESYFPGFEPSAPSQWVRPSVANAIPGSHSLAGRCSQDASTSELTAVDHATYGGRPGNGYAVSSFAKGTVAAAASMFTSTAGGLTRGSPDESRSQPSSSLDSKMRQLNSLLQDQRRPSLTDDGSHGRHNLGSSIHPSSSEVVGDLVGEDPGGDYSSGAIASTLRAMFPHATVRTSQGQNADGDNGSDDGDDDKHGDGAGHGQEQEEELKSQALSVERHLRRLERSVGEQLDARALRSLQALGTRGSAEALAQIDDIVNSHGGRCRNLSSITQSICKKVGKGKKGPRQQDKRPRRVRRVDEDGDAFDEGTDSDGLGSKCRDMQKPSDPEDGGRGLLIRTNSHGSEGSARLHTPASRRSNRSWADIQSGDEEGPADGNLVVPMLAAELADRVGGAGEPEDDEHEHWTPRRVEKAARRGFELRRRGESWELKISMGSLEPPLTEAGMERYCRWLRVRLTSFQEEHGVEALRRCRGEVDFSHNNMSNQMVWMLLETLAQHEVHTALLKLYANDISQGGVLAICEFIRMNERADAVQELHLSHNAIDDESVVELLRTLHTQRPKYPPPRTVEGTNETVLTPVWVRLNHNSVREPDAVKSTVEKEGVTICTARDRTACGTSRCCLKECPLVHLYAFDVQGGHPWRAQGNGSSNVRGPATPMDPDQQSDSGEAAQQRVQDGCAGDGERPRRRDRRRDRRDRRHRDRDHNRDHDHDRKDRAEVADGT